MGSRAEPLRVAVAGLGGFAGSHHAALEILEARAECRVVATCDPDVPARGAEIERFHLAARGVMVLPDLAAMLDLSPDVVTLPTPIPLHAAQHAAVRAAGAFCYLEKPPTLWWPEYREMVERDGGTTQVGFNFVGDPFRQKLRERIQSGEFGPLHAATFLGLWPRGAEYYARNEWAGRLTVGGRPVLDSCIGNAMAHYVQNLLFWTGQEVEGVRAWLARAHPIESYDTAFVEATVAGGARLRIGATHTGTLNFDRETVELREARIVFDSWRSARIEWRDGRTEPVDSSIPDQGAMLRENLSEYFAFVRGERARPATRLEDCEGFVALCGLALVSSGGIADLGGAEAGSHRVVEGLEDRLRAFVDNGAWPEGEPTEARDRDEIERLR